MLLAVILSMKENDERKDKSKPLNQKENEKKVMSINFNADSEGAGM